MTKGKSTWKYNKLLTGRRNYYAYAGPMVKSPIVPIDSSLGGSQNPIASPTPFYSKAPTSQGGSFLGLDWGNPFNGINGGVIKNAAIGAAGAAIGNIGGGLLSGGMSSGAGNLISGLGSIAGTIPGPWGAVACLCEGQRVITRDGRFVNIEDLTPEDGIIGFSEQTNSIAPQTTTLQMLEFYKPCVRIELQSGLNLECSTDHPVYIADSGRATRKYVDGIRTRVKTYSYVKAGDIKTGQYAGVIDEVPIFGNLNVEKAYLIGMLIGDGSYTKRSIVSLHTGDKDTWNYVESNNYGVVVNRFDPGEKYSKEFRTYRITDGCQMMRRLGLYGQSKCTKTLPNNIHLWNKESIANLIAGLWDTDGYVTIESNGKKKHRICFCQSNLSLIRAVQEQLIKFGIHSSIKINKPKKSVIKGKQVNSKEAYVLIIKDKKSCVRFIENIHLNISYKQRNLDRIKEITKAKFTKDNSFIQGVHADKVISITPIGVQRIYNLEAHQDHNYIANFIVTHNSAGLGLLGGLTNRMFGSKLNKENIAKVEANINNLNSFQSNASDFDTLASNWANADVGMTFDNSYIGKDGWFSNKASKKAAKLREQIKEGNAWVQNSLNNNAENIGTTQMQNLLSNYAAFGGELNTQGGDFTNGLLYIDNGGSHELNPYEGVQLGVDPEGVPNLVEEGETVFNDYVFSKRLKVPKGIRAKYKLGGIKDMTFADVSKKLAKESEERPNDPISIRGMRAIMADLANAQEAVKGAQQEEQYANGGRLFDNGGKKGTMNYNNSTTGIHFGLPIDKFNPYNEDGTINWDIMYGNDSPYTRRRQYVLDHWNEEKVQKWLEKYIEGVNEYNKDRKGYTPLTKKGFTRDKFERGTWDKHWGGMHAGVDYAGDPEEKLVIEHMLRNKDGSLIAMPKEYEYYPGTNFETGKTWNDLVSGKYSIANNGNYVENYDPEKHTRTRRYFYDPIQAKTPGTSTNRYYYNIGTKDKPEYVQYTGDDPSLYMKNNGYFAASNNNNDKNGVDYYYDKNDEIKLGEYQDWLRYAPAVGFGIGSITDALGITNKPDYSNTEAILEASRGAGTYQPVKFNPIGNYLTYKPFDRDYYINKMNAEAGASRRLIANTSGGNRATAMAGILAADNNYLNKIGDLAKQAEEYNLTQRQKVEDFNRGTNTTNSEGFLKADMANQGALMNSRELSLKGALTAAEMREKARLAADSARSSNISGLFETLGDIGYDEANKRSADKTIIYTGTPGGERLGYRIKRENKAKNGGKLKRKKGLTF